MLDLLTNDSATQPLELHRIRLDGGTQPRGGLDNNHLDDLRQATRAGLQLPPVSVVYDGTNYWLWDGYHRVYIATQDGQTRIMATIRPGTLADAQWLSYAANQAHGLKRSTADKERAIKAALRHDNAPSLSDRMIADHLGVSDKTVTKYRAELVATAEIPQSPEKRTGRDGRDRPAGSPMGAAAVKPITTDDRRVLTEDETTAVIWRVVKYNVPMHPTVAGLEKWAAYKKYLEHNAHVRNYLSALADGVKLEPRTFENCLVMILNELAQNIAIAQRVTEQPRRVKPDPGYRQTDLNEAIAAVVGTAASDQSLLDDGAAMAPAAPTARFTAAMTNDGWELRQVVATGQWWAYNAQHKRSTATYADPNDAISAAYDKQFDKAPASTESAPDAKRLLDLVWELLDTLMHHADDMLWYDDETTAHERLAEIEAECGFGFTLAARLEEE